MLVPIVMCNLEIDRDLISVVVLFLRFCSPKNSVLQLLCLAPVFFLLSHYCQFVNLLIVLVVM